MKTILLITTAALLTMGTTCSVKSEVKGLTDLKVECEELELELAGLKAKKWTPTIDKQVELCTEHGFWRAPVVKEKQKQVDW